MIDVEEWEAPFARHLRDLLGFVAVSQQRFRLRSVSSVLILTL